ncbi:maleylacetoacetate isomerase [Burkholderia plantarii]|uniref:maleylacetoacetate isomerase n=1 Tax=Burkholderia plantarii TaxID=41899 RepID=UPI0008707228|nr:maleylacetoacetate isomerase [Burkholderia plantarii]
MQLYSHFRSTASFRVRIALALKGLSYQTVAVDLLRGDGEHNTPAFEAINPQRMLPVLVTDDGQRITQSIAICEYLEERYPTRPLLPREANERAYVRSLMAALASDIHPLHSLRVPRFLGSRFALDGEARRTWVQHWIREGLGAIEVTLQRADRAGRYCLGQAPTLADAFLVPQFVSALNNGVQADSFQRVARIARDCLDDPAFAAALPQNQPDAA